MNIKASKVMLEDIMTRMLCKNSPDYLDFYRSCGGRRKGADIYRESGGYNQGFRGLDRRSRELRSVSKVQDWVM